MKLTGEITTTPSALSEAILWDFKSEKLSQNVLDYFGFDRNFIQHVQPVFSEHGRLLKEVARELSLTANIPVTYKAGDQLNNALSLNVLQPGEVAATAGTSGVIYAVTDELFSEPYSRVNAFAHVNHTENQRRLGVLLCINGCGSMNSWIKETMAFRSTYSLMDEAAAKVPPGSDGLMILPFGNGSERMLRNQTIGAQFSGLDLNKHDQGHIFRATQEGIAFAFRYGLDIMRENGLDPKIIRAGKTNLFLSDVFTASFVNTTGISVEFYGNDGSAGAAIGAGIGAGMFTAKQAFSVLKCAGTVDPKNQSNYEELYQAWKEILEKKLINK